MIIHHRSLELLDKYGFGLFKRFRRSTKPDAFDGDTRRGHPHFAMCDQMDALEPK